MQEALIGRGKRLFLWSKISETKFRSKERVILKEIYYVCHNGQRSSKTLLQNTVWQGIYMYITYK